MKHLKTLIKFAKVEVEQYQKDLIFVLAKMDSLDMAQNALDNSRQAERQKATDQPDYAPDFGKFLMLYAQKVKQIDAEKLALQAEIDIAQDKLATAFATEKRFQILLDKHNAAEVSAENIRQQKQLDEVATIMHQQKFTRPE